MKNLDFKGELNLENSSVLEKRNGDSFNLPESEEWIENAIKRLATKGIFPEVGDKIEGFHVVSIEFYLSDIPGSINFWIDLQRED